MLWTGSGCLIVILTWLFMPVLQVSRVPTIIQLSLLILCSNRMFPRHSHNFFASFETEPQNHCAALPAYFQNLKQKNPWDLITWVFAALPFSVWTLAGIREIWFNDRNCDLCNCLLYGSDHGSIFWTHCCFSVCQASMPIIWSSYCTFCYTAIHWIHLLSTKRPRSIDHASCPIYLSALRRYHAIRFAIRRCLLEFSAWYLTYHHAEKKDIRILRISFRV